MTSRVVVSLLRVHSLSFSAYDFALFDINNFPFKQPTNPTHAFTRFEPQHKLNKLIVIRGIERGYILFSFVVYFVSLSLAFVSFGCFSCNKARENSHVFLFVCFTFLRHPLILHH